MEDETLPVFSSAGEAIRFALAEGLLSCWRAENMSAEELRIWLLDGSPGGFSRIALDPWPGGVSDGTIALVSIDRETFLWCLPGGSCGEPGR